jgi:hypothetical protein
LATSTNTRWRGRRWAWARRIEREHDRLAGREALGGGGVEQLAGLLVDLLVGHPAGQQAAQPGHREQDVGVLEHAGAERLAGGFVGGDDDDQTPRCVADAVGRAEHPAADADVGLALGTLGLAGAARAL